MPPITCHSTHLPQSPLPLPPANLPPATGSFPPCLPVPCHPFSNPGTPAVAMTTATHQIRRTANTVYEASTPSRRNRERSHRSTCSRSPVHGDSVRKRRRSRSPKYDPGLPSDRLEKRARENAQRTRREKLEFFCSSAGPRGGVCAVCLGCHEHSFSKCDSDKLWNGTDGSARKNEQGRLVAADGLPICFDWQVQKGCTSTSHLDRHKCSGCGKGDHGAQGCP